MATHARGVTDKTLLPAAPFVRPAYAPATEYEEDQMNSWMRSAVLSADRLGVAASFACAVHCVLMPVVLSLSAVYAHLLPTEEHTHRVLAVLVSALGGIALGLGYRRHRRRRPLALMAVGLLLIGAGALFGERLPSHTMEMTITLCGSACMIAAHRWNHTFCRQCERCTETCGQ